MQLGGWADRSLFLRSAGSGDVTCCLCCSGLRKAAMGKIARARQNEECSAKSVAKVRRDLGSRGLCDLKATGSQLDHRSSSVGLPLLELQPCGAPQLQKLRRTAFLGTLTLSRPFGRTWQDVLAASTAVGFAQVVEKPDHTPDEPVPFFSCCNPQSCCSFVCEGRRPSVPAH